jgi:hypothetical protein
VIGLDTNVLARYYIEDKSDPQAENSAGAPPSCCSGHGPLCAEDSAA